VKSAAQRGLPLQAFGDLIVALIEQLPMGVLDAAGTTSVEVTSVALDLPLETRLGRGAEVRASLPRGRLATGFQIPLGRLSAHFQTEAEPARTPVEGGAV
jgi:hypothetical protein